MNTETRKKELERQLRALSRVEANISSQLAHVKAEEAVLISLLNETTSSSMKSAVDCATALNK